MRKLLLGLAVALFATTASAQAAKPFLGVGAKVGEGTAVVAVPMNVSPIIRVEPYLGYTQNRYTDASDPAGDFKRWSSELALGAGVFLVNDVGSNVELHYGGRLGIVRVAQGFEDEAVDFSDDTSDMGFQLAAVGGAEYYFSPRFALGVEAEIYVDTIEYGDTDERYTNFGTNTFVTARLYFK